MMVVYSGQGGEVLVQYEGECCRQPPVDPSGWEGAVCATNGRTYPDTTVIANMRKFGQCEYTNFVKLVVTIYFTFYFVTKILNYNSTHHHSQSK